MLPLVEKSFMEKADLPINNPDANVPVALRKLLLFCMKLIDVIKIKY
jgi:hypothetical protein